MFTMNLRSVVLAGVLLGAAQAAQAQRYQVSFDLTTELQNVFVYGDEWNGEVYAWDLFPAALGTVPAGHSTYQLGSHNLKAWSVIANHGLSAAAAGINSSINPPVGLPFETVFPGYPESIVAANIAALCPGGVYNVQPAYYLFDFALTNEDTLKTDLPADVLHVFTFSNGVDVGTATFALSPACTAPSVSQSPSSVWTCPQGNASFSVAAAGTEPLAYRWQSQTAGGWVDVFDGPLTGAGGVLVGAAFDCGYPTVHVALTRDFGHQSEFVNWRCVVTNACGRATSGLASITVCPADFNCDGAVDFFDYDEFVVAFEIGTPNADFDQDGTVDFFDYDAFVVAFETPC